jgi:DNA-binding response OmpR family regulator
MILVSDRDEEMRAMLTAQLREVGIECFAAGSPREVRAQLPSTRIQVWVTDVVFPEVKLEEMIREVRSWSPQTQILVLVGAIESEAAETEVVRLIEAGATDFLVKPFERKALVNRVQGLLRRLGGLPHPGAAPILSLGDLVLDPASFDVYCGTERAPLTPSEFKLLHALMLERGAVLSRDQLIRLVQGVGIVVVDRAVDTHVASLRKKLGPCGSFIETVRGVGYRIRG